MRNMGNVIKADCDLINNFKAGDLLYGVEIEREKFRTVIRQAHKGIDCTIDVVNNWIVYASKNASAEDGNAVLEMKNVNDESALKELSEKFLAHLKEELKSEKFKDKFSKVLIAGKKADVTRYNCQSGIRYVVSDKNDATTLHFELSGIELSNIFTRDAMENKCFTTSEIRKVVRLIQLKTIAYFPRDKVKFYNFGQSISLEDFLQFIRCDIDAVDLTTSPIKKTIANDDILARSKKRSSISRIPVSGSDAQCNVEIRGKRALFPDDENISQKKPRK